MNYIYITYQVLGSRCIFIGNLSGSASYSVAHTVKSYPFSSAVSCRTNRSPNCDELTLVMTLCDELTLCRNTSVRCNWEAHVRTGVGRDARAVTSGWLSGGCVERPDVHATRTTTAGCVCHVDAWRDGSKSY